MSQTDPEWWGLVIGFDTDDTKTQSMQFGGTYGTTYSKIVGNLYLGGSGQFGTGITLEDAWINNGTPAINLKFNNRTAASRTLDVSGHYAVFQ